MKNVTTPPRNSWATLEPRSEILKNRSIPDVPCDVRVDPVLLTPDTLLHLVWPGAGVDTASAGFSVRRNETLEDLRHQTPEILHKPMQSYSGARDQ